MLVVVGNVMRAKLFGRDDEPFRWFGYFFMAYDQVSASCLAAVPAIPLSVFIYPNQDRLCLGGHPQPCVPRNPDQIDEGRIGTICQASLWENGNPRLSLGVCCPRMCSNHERAYIQYVHRRKPFSAGSA